LLFPPEFPPSQFSLGDTAPKRGETTFGLFSESLLAREHTRARQRKKEVVRGERNLFAVEKGAAIRLCLAAMLPAICAATPQHQSQGESTGTLEVTATVVGSVGVIVTPDGRCKVVVANAPDAAFLEQEAITLLQERRRKKPPEGGGNWVQTKKGRSFRALSLFQYRRM
jgi:hypothetical protein